MDYLTHSPNYKTSASIYDTIHGQRIDALADRLKVLLAEYNIQAGRILDLGCGTGRGLNNICSEKFEGVGIDPSIEMIKIAKSKYRSSKIRFEVESIQSFVTNLQFTAEFCLNDAINYIKPQEWPNALQNISKNLLSGGIFYFDFTTYSDFFDVWNGHSEFTEGTGWVCFKTHSFDDNSKLGLEIQNWFLANEHGYQRFVEKHELYAVRVSEILDFAAGAGLNLRCFLNPETFDIVTDLDNFQRLGCVMFKP